MNRAGGSGGAVVIGDGDGPGDIRGGDAAGGSEGDGVAVIVGVGILGGADGDGLRGVPVGGGEGEQGRGQGDIAVGFGQADGDVGIRCGAEGDRQVARGTFVYGQRARRGDLNRTGGGGWRGGGVGDALVGEAQQVVAGEILQFVGNKGWGVKQENGLGGEDGAGQGEGGGVARQGVAAGVERGVLPLKQVYSPSVFVREDVGQGFAEGDGQC